MAGFGFLNNYFYGKAGKGDFTPDQLPKNRVALFFSVLRIRFASMIALNLMYVVFLLPLILWTAMYLATVLDASVATAPTPAIDGNLLIYLLGMIPCQMLAGVGAPGMMYVLRNWSRDQHAFMVSDFKDAIKGNWKAGLLTGLLNGLSLPVAYVCYAFYGTMARDAIAWLIPQVLVLVAVVVWWMVNMVIFTGMVTYALSYRNLLRNSLIIVVARLPWSFLFLLGTAGIPIAAVLLSGYGILIVAVTYLLIGFSLTGLIYASYANSCFDKYINPKIDGAPVNMGLRKADPDDEDEDAPV